MTNGELLERMIDAEGLPRVVAMLAIIAGEKAEHVATNWQDARTAKSWERCASRLSTCADACRHWLPYE